MKSFLFTCLKIMAGLMIGLILLHFFPIAIVPAIGLLFVAGLFAIFIFAGTVTAGALGIALCAVLLAVAVALVSAASPIWIPVVVILGIIWLIKRLGRSGSRPIAG
jgi:hypothetical protein